jgi:ABC-type spermidine/putrescine transport system permease subunit II
MFRVVVSLVLCVLSACALAWTHERGHEVANMVCWPLAVMAIITAAAWCCQ